MKFTLLFLCILIFITSCKTDEHQHSEPTHNFTVNRLLILNENNEILMGKEAGMWFTMSHIYDKRQYIKESLDSLANSFGIKISSPKLRGYLSYKYEYYSYATQRAYYVANYISGEPKLAGNIEEVKWMQIDEAIESTPVESMKLVIRQILENPNILWGGSFLIYRKGEHHHARMVEDFYVL